MHAGVGVCRPGAAPSSTGRIPTHNFAARFLDRFNQSVSAPISSSQQLSTQLLYAARPNLGRLKIIIMIDRFRKKKVESCATSSSSLLRR